MGLQGRSSAAAALGELMALANDRDRPWWRATKATLGKLGAHVTGEAGPPCWHGADQSSGLRRAGGALDRAGRARWRDRTAVVTSAARYESVCEGESGAGQDGLLCARIDAIPEPWRQQFAAAMLGSAFVAIKGETCITPFAHDWSAWVRDQWCGRPGPIGLN